MLYAMLCYNDENAFRSSSPTDEDAVMRKLAMVKQRLSSQGRLGPTARLLPTTTAITLRKGDPPLVLDGPFAETKEQLLGFYIVECASREEAIATAWEFAAAIPGGSFEIRAVQSSAGGWPASR